MKTKIFASLVFGIMFLTVPLCQAQNLLTDGDFSLTTEIIPFNTPVPIPFVWWTWLNYDTGTNAIATVVDGVCKYEVISPGINVWDVQLAQWGFLMEQGHSYRLSFKVKADANRTFGVFLGENGGNWINLFADRYIQNATTEWQTINLEFNAPCVFASNKLSFELGTIATNMYFDNVVLEDLGIRTSIPSIGILGSAVTV